MEDFKDDFSDWYLQFAFRVPIHILMYVFLSYELWWKSHNALKGNQEFNPVCNKKNNN